MIELGSYESTVIANKSFRTVIPKPIAKALGLEHKSKILWMLKVRDGNIEVTVKRIED